MLCIIIHTILCHLASFVGINLCEAPLSSMRKGRYTNLNYYYYYIFMSVVDRHMPLKRRHFRAESVPWFTSEYLSMIDRRAYIAKLCKNCPYYFHEHLTIHAQRLCQHLKNQLKRNYVSTVMERHKSNPKKIWKNIRRFWPSGKG